MDLLCLQISILIMEIKEVFEMIDFNSNLIRLISRKGLSKFIHPGILKFLANFKYLITTVTNQSRIHERIKNRLNFVNFALIKLDFCGFPSEV
jgi:hypothetical protein